MQDQQIIQQLHEADSEARLGDLGGRIADDAREGPNTIVETWIKGDEEQADNAGAVLLDLEELAIPGFLDQAARADIKWRIQTTALATDQMRRLRGRLFSGLDPLLNNRGPSPEAPRGEAVPRRICDDTYISIRRLVNMDTGEMRGLHSESEFLRMDHVQRDEEIVRWQRSRLWEQLKNPEIA